MTTLRDPNPPARPSPHGSAARVPGQLTRAMSALYLAARPEWTREHLVRRLQQHLAGRGIHFHERSLRRHIRGSVASVPPELEAALEELLQTDLEYTSRESITAALEARGLASSRPDPDYVEAERAVVLTRLWLFLHPETSKRALSLSISEKLAQRGVTVGLDALQSELAGRGQLVRREVIDALLEALAGDGVPTEAAARERAAAAAAEIEAFEQGRELVDGDRFRTLARQWQLMQREASSRRLATQIEARLRDRGVRLGLDHLQRLISGKARRVRVEVLQVMEEMMTDAPATASEPPTQDTAIELAWVDAQPIHELAKEWLRENPGTTARQLALKVAETVREMGYSTSHSTIQPILGGWKQRTRGFVYRAMLRQFEGTDGPRPGWPTPEVPAKPNARWD